MMVLHGWPKLIGGPDLWAQLGTAMKHVGVTAVPPLWGFAAALAETLGGTLLVFGFFFRLAAIVLLATMIVATVKLFSISGGEFLDWAWPAEMAILFAALILIGPGKFSIDRS